jgi:hypothetical protein
MAKLVIEGKGLRDEVLKLKEGVYRLGRSTTNDSVVLDYTFSRFYCEIDVNADTLIVRNLDSTNGTFVDDQPVDHAELHDGETLRLANVRLEVCEAPKPVVEGSVPMCFLHSTYPANMECTQCHKIFCGTCIHILRRSGGKVLRLCPQCSGYCVPLGALRAGSKGFLQDLVGKLFKKCTARHPFLE